MVHKKYIEKNGKRYGPYYYESYRDSEGHVKKRYIAHPKKSVFETIKTSRVTPFVVLFALIAIAFVHFHITGNPFTGGVVSEILPVYSLGETLGGQIKFNLREGEFIPADALVTIKNGNQTKQLLLSELISNQQKTTGDFYVENFEISGQGEGFGVAGKKIAYPEVLFELAISEGQESQEPQDSDSTTPSEPSEDSNETSSSSPSESETPTEEPIDSSTGLPSESETPITTENPSESEPTAESEAPTESEQPAEPETPSEPEPETSSPSESSSEPSSSSESESVPSESSSAITGAIISEQSQIIKGSVRKGEDYIYSLTENTQAEIVPGSAQVQDVLIDDSFLQLTTKDNQAVVSTNYETVEEGFGEDYLGNYTLALELDLSEFGISVTDSLVELTLSYNEQVLLEAESLLIIEGQENSSENITDILTENITEEIISNLTENITLETINITTARNLIRVGQPVKWVKNISLESAGAEPVKVNLPAEATNIIVKEKKNEDDKKETAEEFEQEQLNEEITEPTNNSSEEIKEEVVEEENITEPPAEQQETVAESETEQVIEVPITETTIDSSGILTGNAVVTFNLQKESKIKNWFKGLYSSITGRAITEEVISPEIVVDKITEVIEVELPATSTEYVIEYETPAPTSIETEILRGKQVIVSGPDNLNYENVVAFTTLDERLNLKDYSKIKIQWVENQSEISPLNVSDMDLNGIYDYVEWVVPHLSNQTFNIIIITNAEHLDENKTFVSDIYEQVQAQDDVWSEEIPENHYVRVTFERNLTSGKDITIFPEIVSGSPRIEIYEKDGNETIAEFTEINSNELNKVYLEGLEDRQQDTFDLKILEGSVKFDYITDPDPIFSSVWRTTLTSTGSSNSTQVRLPLYNGGIYNFTVDWGDGVVNTVTAYNDGNVTHNYPGAGGEYTINITGTIVGFRFNNAGDRLKLIDIKSFGPLNLGDSNGYFYGCTTMRITATDVLNLTGTRSMYFAFRTASNLTTVPSMNSWNMSAINDTYYMFEGARYFNQNISEWDTSNVTNMGAMFQGTTYGPSTEFNQDISRWNTSKVTRMDSMFYYSKFNQSIADWDVSKVTTMATMFRGSSFSQDISGWDTSNVTSMYAMFMESSFRGNISNWNTSKLTSIAQGFQSGYVPYDIGNWDISKVTDLGSVFNYAYFYQGAPNIGKWNISGVTSTSNSLYGAYSFSTAYYDEMLSGWAKQSLKTGLILNSVPARYCDVGAREVLDIYYAWSITDTGINSTCLSDTTSPVYLFEVSANDTVVGSLTKFSNFWMDARQLNGTGQYIFSTNNTGTWVNDTAVDFTLNYEWANVTKRLNTTSGNIVSYMWYAKDNAGNWNATGIYNVTTTGDSVSPSYSQTSVNSSKAGESTQFFALWGDNGILESNGQYIFSTNNSGTWVNETAVNFTTTPSWANVTKALNPAVGIAIGYMWYASDNAGNWGATPIIKTVTRSDSLFGVYDCQELQNINNNLEGDYVLESNIDCSGTTSWNSGLGFNPIGDEESGLRFSGTLDGNGYQISGLYINRTTFNYTGLFSSIGETGEVKNLSLNNPFFGGNFYTGGIVGINYGQINNIFLYGADLNQGLKGNNNYLSEFKGIIAATQSASGVISNSFAGGSVKNQGGSNGGLMGLNYGQVINCSSNATVEGTSYGLPGGLVGVNNGTISNSSSEGYVLSTYDYAGGLVSNNYGTIDNSYFKGNVTSPYYSGGLVGENFNIGFISNSYSSGKVIVNHYSSAGEVGGFVGSNAGKIVNCSSNSTVYDPTTSYKSSPSIIGGFVGLLEGGQINSSYSNSYVYSGTNANLGGFVGRITSATSLVLITDCYSKGNTTGVSSSAYTGGFFGGTASSFTNSVIIQNCYSIGNVTGTYSGGFIGSVNNGDKLIIKNCYSTGNVSLSSYRAGFAYNLPTATTVQGVYYYNGTGYPPLCYYSGAPTLCTGISSGDHPPYFYGIKNSPMNSWDFSGIWSDDFDSTDYPTLLWQNSTPSSDVVNPSYSFISYSGAQAGGESLFSILWNDNIVLQSNGQYIFSTNNTGAWVNDTAINFTATPNWANVTKTLNTTTGIPIGYMWYASDNAGNWNATPINVLTTAEYDLQITNPTTATPVSVLNGDNITLTFNVQENGANLSESVIVSEVIIGESSVDILNYSLSIRTGQANYTEGMLGSVNFNTPLQNESYAILFSGGNDSDSVFSVEWGNKQSDGFNFQIQDDTGLNETVTDNHWAAIEYGEYNFSNFLIKCNNGSGASTATIPFTSAFPDSNYAIVASTLIDDDSPAVSYTAKTSANWSSRIHDDGDTLEVVSGLDWCAVSYGNLTLGNKIIQAGYNTTSGAAEKVITLQTPFADTNYFVLTTASMAGLTADPCSIEISSKTITNFTITAEDDDTTNNCNGREFNWIAISSVEEEIPQVGYVSGEGWQANITVPSGGDSLEDLFIEAVYTTPSGSILINDTETEAISYTRAPTYSLINYNSTKTNQATLFSSLWDDNYGLHTNGQYIFSTNNTGEWLNDSAINFTETPSWANVTKILNDTGNLAIGYLWYARDNAGNWNSTPISVLTTKDYQIQITTPTTENPAIVSSGDNLSVLFNFLENGVNVTTGFELDEVTIGGTEAPVLVGPNFEMIGTPSTGWVASGTSSTDVNLPSGLREGDIILVALASDIGLGADGVNTNGYVHIYHSTSDAPGHNVAYKIMDSNPDSVVNILQYNGYRTAYVIQAWRGVNITNPLDVAVTSTSGSSGDPNSPSITPVTSGALVFTVGVIDDDDGTVTTVPAGYTSSSYNNTAQSSSNGATVVMASKKWSSGIAEDPAAWVLSSDDYWFAYSIALKPINRTQFEYISGKGWQANVTVPNKEDTLEDLTVSGVYSEISLSETEIDSVDYRILPTYSLINHNTSYVSQAIKFSILWDDNLALHPNGQYIFSTNNTGGWVNDSAVNFTATPEWANVTKLLNNTVGIAIGYMWYASDNGGGWNATGINVLTTVDGTAPTYSNVAYNSTDAAKATKFSILWNDETALQAKGQYIFSTNNTGGWVNDSAVNFTATPEWANVTKLLNNTVGIAIGYMWYAKDNAGNWQSTGVLSLSTGDTTPPVYSAISYNSSNVSRATKFSILWDDTDLFLNSKGQYIFSTNNTGGWVNDSAVNFTATPEWANVTKLLNNTVGIPIGYLWYAKDNAQNWNATPINVLTTVDQTPPTYSSMSVDTTQAGALASFTIVWTDETALHPNGMRIFSTNNTGVWVNSSYTPFLGTPFSGGVSIVLNNTAGIAVGYIWYANDTNGNWNSTGIQTLTTTDTIAPTYSAIAHNSTDSGKATKFSVLWNDNPLLNPKGQYIFSTNNTGSWVNDTAVNFTATPEWANVTKLLNSTSGIAIGYIWYASDNAGNWNSTGINVLTSADSAAPTYSAIAHNNTNSNEKATFFVLWDDNNLLQSNGQYIFSTNNTGSWVNDTAVNFTATPEWANVTKFLNSTVGIPIGYMWYASDNAGNWNATGINVLTTTQASVFSSVWNTSKSGSASNMVILPLQSIGIYDFFIDWGDGKTNTSTSYLTNHTYDAPGVYTINITGKIRGWTFNNGGDKLKLIEIKSWGPLNLGNSASYFYGCSNMIVTATDVLNLTGTTNLYSMFRGASSLTTVPSMNEWDTSQVRAMNNTFSSASSFNQNISNWDTSNVTRMDSMFYGAYVFNQSIGGWNTSKVTDMSTLFYGANSFTQDISNWDTSNVLNMYAMFMNNNIFNGNISNWDTRNVYTMQSMFNNADAFNQPLGNWNVSNVTNMNSMFAYTANFNQNLENWNTQKVTTIASMFEDALSFNGSLANWDTGKLTTMVYAFKGATNFNGNISNWNTSSLRGEGLVQTFYHAKSFNQPLNNWNTSGITSLSWTFLGAESFNQDLDRWDTSKVTNFQYLFDDAINFNGNISTWDTSNVTIFDGVFNGAFSFNQPIGSWNVSKVTWFQHTFVDAVSFNQDISSWNTSSATMMSGMFKDAISFNQDLSNWRFPLVTDLTNMFYNATSFDQNLSSWNVSKITTMTDMFKYSTLSTANYDSLLNGWASQSPNLKNSVPFHGGNSKYSLAGNASRNGVLVGTHSWSITDGGFIDLVSPTYSAIAHNSSNAGEAVLFSALWDDETALNAKGQYIFSTNNTGLWVNDTAVNFTATPNWANVTKTLNFAVGIAVGYMWYAKDNTGNWNATEINVLTTADSFAPTYSNIAHNSTEPGRATLFSALWNDNMALHTNGIYIFSTNNTGEWVNDTAVNFTATPEWANVTKTLNTTTGIPIGYMWYASDNAGNWNATDIQTLITTPEGAVFSSVWNTSKTSTGSTSSNQVGLPLESTGVYNFIVNWGDGSSNLITSYNQAEVNHTYATEGNYTINITGTIQGFRFNNVSDKLKLTEIKSFGPLNLGNSNGYFYGCSNMIITATDVLNLTGTTTMYHAFRDASSLTTVPSMNEWDMSQVNSLSVMFYLATNFNQNISNWDTSQVTTMQAMFGYATNFNQNLSNWNTSKVTTMTSMFAGATNFNQNLSDWDTSNVTTMASMFDGATNFNGNVSTWDTHNVTSMQTMFRAAKNFNQPIGNWNTSKVTTITYMFNGATNFNQPIGDWDTSKVTSMESMFSNADNFNQNLSDWDTSEVISMRTMFYHAHAFNGNISNWDTHNVIIFTNMFTEATNFNQPIGNWNTSKVIDMNSIFFGATNFNQPIGDWDTSKVTNMGYVFYNAQNFNQNLSNWNTSQVNTTYAMFYQAYKFNGNISTWDTHNVTTMRSMFGNTYDFNQNISNWDTSNVTNMYQMFAGAINFNQPLDSWNTSKVTDMYRMFYIATAFNQNLSNWNVSSLLSATEMFTGVTLSTPNYDSLLTGWASQTPTLQNSVPFHGGNSKYCAGGSARNDTLIGIHSWTITDGGVSPTCDLIAPTYSNINANSTEPGRAVLFSALWNDNMALHTNGTYIFSTNNTGEWANDTAINFTATPNWANVTKILNETNNTPVGYIWYSKDNAQNWNATGINVVVALSTNSAPNDPVVTINSSDGSNKTLQDLNCFANIYDPDANTMNVSLRWWKNDTLNLSQEFTGSYANGTLFNAVLEDGNTSKGDIWKCEMRLYDGIEYSNWTNSSTLTILNTLPTVTLSAPPTGNTTTDRTPSFSWVGEDDDGDSLTYQMGIELQASSLCSDPDRNITGIGSTSHTLEDELRCLLDNGDYYLWSVAATDGVGYGEWASQRNISIVSLIEINLTNRAINFGVMNQMESNDTSDDNPLPFKLQNIGNALVNITVQGSSLWESAPSPTEYLKYKAANRTNANAFNFASSITGFTILPIEGDPDMCIAELNYSDGNDIADIDIYVEVPPNEYASANRHSNITFTASLAE